LDLILQLQAEDTQKAKNDPSYKRIFPAAEKIFFYKGAWE
jgi:hypothetical protein